MKTVGFFYTCFNEKRALDYSIEQLRVHYPESSIYLVSDGGIDYSYLKDQYENIDTSLEEDTMSETFKITGELDTGNFREEHYQKVIKNSVYAVLSRVERAIKYCNYPDWMVMCDPDCLIRGKLNFPENAKILGTRLNCCLPQGYRNILNDIEGAIPITNWGASPCVFEVKTFLTALEKFRYLDANENLLNRLCMEFYAMYAHDVLFPTLFALVGEEEVFNPDIVECTRNPNWTHTSQPLVHQFREYY